MTSGEHTAQICTQYVPLHHNPKDIPFFTLSAHFKLATKAIWLLNALLLAFN